MRSLIVPSRFGVGAGMRELSRRQILADELAGGLGDGDRVQVQFAIVEPILAQRADGVGGLCPASASAAESCAML